MSSAPSLESVRERIARFPHWYHQIEVVPGVTTPGINASGQVMRVLDQMNLPKDCRGLSVLDIGARDGFFSFALEQRGAEVLALDYMPPDQTGYAIASELVGSKVPYQVANVYDLTPERFGTFDLVLFLGVLYHLRDPLLALDHVRSVCKDQMWIESQVIDDGFLNLATGQMQSLKVVAPNIVSTPIMQFYPRDTLNRDFTNWWAPNMACLRALLESANFAVLSARLNGGRGLMHCRITNDDQVNHFRELDKGVVSG